MENATYPAFWALLQTIAEESNLWSINPLPPANSYCQKYSPMSVWWGPDEPPPPQTHFLGVGVYQ